MTPTSVLNFYTYIKLLTVLELSLKLYIVHICSFYVRRYAYVYDSWSDDVHVEVNSQNANLLKWVMEPLLHSTVNQTKNNPEQ